MTYEEIITTIQNPAYTITFRNGLSLALPELDRLRAELATANATNDRLLAINAGHVERIAALEGALRKAAHEHTTSAHQFAFYASQHLAKQPPDVAKAETNTAHEARCRQAFANAKEVSVDGYALEARVTAKAAFDG